MWYGTNNNKKKKTFSLSPPLAAIDIFWVLLLYGGIDFLSLNHSVWPRNFHKNPCPNPLVHTSLCVWLFNATQYTRFSHLSSIPIAHHEPRYQIQIWWEETLCHFPSISLSSSRLTQFRTLFTPPFVASFSFFLRAAIYLFSFFFTSFHQMHRHTYDMALFCSVVVGSLSHVVAYKMRVVSIVIVDSSLRPLLGVHWTIRRLQCNVIKRPTKLACTLNGKHIANEVTLMTPYTRTNGTAR